MSVFINTAEISETSQEIIDAIWLVSGKNETEAFRVWGAPTKDELFQIIDIVTENGIRKASDFCWGSSGSRWTDYV